MVKRANDKQYADDTPDETVLVPKFAGDFAEFRESEVLQLLSDILTDVSKQPAYYVGGTLCIDYCRDKHSTPEVLIFNVMNADMGFAIQAMVAQIYIKYKTDKHFHWKAAQAILAKGNKVEEVV